MTRVWISSGELLELSAAAFRRLITTDHPIPLDDLVIRIDQRKHRVAHLDYPGFFSVP